MYKPGEQVSKSGLYRCTTCGLMIPVETGETLPACPTRCPDTIWTFFNEKANVPPGETREASDTFPALDLNGDPIRIPAGAVLTDVHLGPELPNQPAGDRKLAAFYYNGKVYFGSASELLEKTTLVRTIR